MASETVQMALSRSSRTFGEASQRQAMQMGNPRTPLSMTGSIPKETSERNHEMYQTMVYHAKNYLHPRLPWPGATETLQAAGGHPSRVGSLNYAGPQGRDLKNCCPLDSFPESLPGFSAPLCFLWAYFSSTVPRSRHSLQHMGM